ncbi:MAG: HXXEE domain-containing protein, partial [Patescibacteria group bacterium]
LEQFFLISLVVQLVHSVEELTTGFHKKWYLFKMPFPVFLCFELLFSAFWIFVFFSSVLYREHLQAFFLILMFANGIQHLVWWGWEKKYVPGLITAFTHIAVFLVFYFKVIF